jgi:hypothetical protein
MIKIITIDREYGSGAADIAATLAARLGWKLWDQLLTIKIARITGSFEGTVNAQRVKMVDAEAIREAPLRSMGKSEEGAHLLARTVDQDRAAYIKQYFKVQWPLREI